MFFKEIPNEFALFEMFPTEESCVAHLEKLFWGNRVVSPFDENSKVYRCKSGKYHCKNTGKYFNVRTGTMFDGTKLPLKKWFFVIWKVLSNKKGVSSHQIARDLGITQKTAWFLLQKIRIGLDIQDGEPMEEDVQVDEALFGGKNANRHVDKKRQRNAEGSYTDKVYVVGMVDTKGLLKTFMVKDRTELSIKPLLLRNIVKGSRVISDGHKAYANIGTRFEHHTVKDGKRCKTDFHDCNINTNRIENAWTCMKESYIGIYNWVSRKHFQKYLNEWTFRYNTKSMRLGERFNFFFHNIAPKITQKQIVHGL